MTLNSIYLWLYSPLLDLGRFLQFLDLFTQSVGLLGRGSVRRKAATYTHRTAQKQCGI
jgi:hypothetical protein